MTLTATYDGALSRVRLSVDSTGDGDLVLFERSTNGITWSTVRGGEAVRVDSGTGAASLDDYEFAPNVVNHYRATPRLHETFEDPALSITIGQGTSDLPWSRADDTANTGLWSFKSGAITADQTSDAIVTVPAGAESVAFSWKVSSEPDFDFFYFLVDGVIQGTGAAGEFGWLDFAPYDIAGATTFGFRYLKDSDTSVGDDAAWIDDVVIRFVPQSTTITPPLDTVWLKNLAYPFLNRAVTVTDFDTVERPARGGIFPVVGRSFPVAVTDVRGSRRYELEVMVPTVAESDDLDLCLSAGDPVLVHVPDDPDCLVPRTMYAVVGDVEIDRKQPRGVRRYFTLPLTEVAAPGPDIVGATVTWEGVVSAFATWSDLVAGEPTWESVLERIGDPSEVIVP